MSPTYVSGRDIVRPSFQKTGLAGLDRVINNINKEIKRIEGACLKGLIRAALKVRRDTENTTPLTPVDIGNMRASFFITTSRGGTPYNRPKFNKGPGTSGKKISDEQLSQLSANHDATIAAWQAAIAGTKPIVALGYTANYAVFVHEMMGPINWSRPGSGPKWFQAAFRRNKDAVLQVIKDEVQISK